jgi:hypothetical protein
VLIRLFRQTGSVELHLTSATGARLFSESFVYYAPESIISAAPSRGDAAGGLRVTVTGTGFTLLSGPPGEGGDGAACRFAGVQVPATIVTSSLLACSAPRLRAGEAALEVSSNGADFTASGAAFVAAHAPAVRAVSPTISSTVGGTGVTVLGSGFVLGASCGFGDVWAPAEVVSSSKVLCISPTHAAGDVQLQVSLNEMEPGARTVRFAFRPPPLLRLLTPSIGSPTGGTAVTLLGENFEDIDALCFFGRQPVAAAFVSSSMVSCVSPSAEVGYTDLVVETNHADIRSNAMSFQVSTLPQVKPMNPQLCRKQLLNLRKPPAVH